MHEDDPEFEDEARQAFLKFRDDQHADMVAGRMTLLFRLSNEGLWRWRWSRQALRRLGFIRGFRSVPVVRVPFCPCKGRGECPRGDVADPVFPASCGCRARGGKHERDWRAGCPDHGLDSSWAHAEAVREHLERKKKK